MTEEEFENSESVGIKTVGVKAVMSVPAVKEPLSKEERKEISMMKAGITDDLVMKTAYEGLVAVKEVEDFDAQGNIRVVKKPDHIVRHKFLDTILRVKGYIRNDATIESTVNFNLTVSEREAIRGRLKKVIDIGGNISGDV